MGTTFLASCLKTTVCGWDVTPEPAPCFRSQQLITAQIHKEGSDPGGFKAAGCYEGNWQFAWLAVHHVRQPGTRKRCDSCQLGTLITPALNNSVYLKGKQQEKGSLIIIINIKIITRNSQCSALN